MTGSSRRSKHLCPRKAMAPRREGPFCYQDGPERRDAGASVPTGFDDMVGIGEKGVLGGDSPRGDGRSAKRKGLGLHD